MNSAEFVQISIDVIKNPAVIGTLKNLESPAGRKPSDELVALSEWYKSLDNYSKEMLTKAFYMVADSCMFGFFAVLDGVRTIEDQENKGEIELYYINNGDRNLLNNPDDEFLHDIYKSLV